MKKTIKTLAIVAAWSATAFAAYWVGTQTWFFDIHGRPYHYTSQEAEIAERRYCGAALNLLHRFYQEDKQRWHSEIMGTQEYKDLETANGGDWEDFYCDW